MRNRNITSLKIKIAFIQAGRKAQFDDTPTEVDIYPHGSSVSHEVGLEATSSYNIAQLLTK